MCVCVCKTGVCMCKTEMIKREVSAQMSWVAEARSASVLAAVSLAVK